MSVNNHIRRHHHLTLSVGNAQEDYDFHTKVLGLKSVKKTALYDGEEPILHLYYGNDTGDVSRLITCFPDEAFRSQGPQGHRADLYRRTVDSGRLRGFLAGHLEGTGFPRYSFRSGSASGWWHSTIPAASNTNSSRRKADARKPYSNGAVPQEHGLEGTYGIVVSVRDAENSEEFMQGGWNGRRSAPTASTCATKSATAAAAPSSSSVSSRTWPRAAGPMARASRITWPSKSPIMTRRAKVKFHLEGLGFTDVSEMKDRGYFDSVYVRTPGGALFEATVSKPQGFLVDEPYEKLGTADADSTVLRQPPRGAAGEDRAAQVLRSRAGLPCLVPAFSVLSARPSPRTSMTGTAWPWRASRT